MTCFCPGADAASSPHGKDTLQSMVVSANARLLTKMGRVYIDSKQRISKGMFDDDEFRASSGPCARRSMKRGGAGTRRLF